MSENTTDLDMNKINESIADRSDVFYWQTDRAVEPEQAGQIWADRHRYFTDEQLLININNALTDDKLATVNPLDLSDQTNLGNVSSVRAGRLESGDEIVARCFPRGVLNGYFHVEAVAADKTRAAGLPSYKTLAIHDFEGGDDFAFHVLEKLPGTAITVWLDAHPEDEEGLVTKVGSMMARLHQIEVEGFGPFDNEKAKNGELVGLHNTQAEAVRAGLTFNLGVLEGKGMLTTVQKESVIALFSEDNPFLTTDKPVLVHNDFADWNLLTDGKEVTGILDFDECVAGDPVADIACWSTFFEPERLQEFLDGYWQVAQQPADFKDKFELFRLRYVVSKMTLRLRRYEWEPSEIIKARIDTGAKHLAQSLEYFGL